MLSEISEGRRFKPTRGLAPIQTKRHFSEICIAFRSVQQHSTVSSIRIDGAWAILGH
jgi:hypothetical protein